MTVGISVTLANALLNAVFRSTPYAEPDAVYAKLHIGDPGAAGTTNAAGNTTRQQIVCGVDAASGTISNTAVVTWTNVNTAEDYTHITIWDSATAGTFVASGTITANPVLVGDTFTLPIGDLDINFTSLAA
jgi:hypothetical protein